MLSDRISRWRYRVGTRMYEMRREQSLRAARWRYRLDNLGMSSHLKTGILLLLAFLPFVVYFLIQPSNPTVVDDGSNEISNFSDPPQPPLAFPLSTPTPPAPAPSVDPLASPTPSPEPSPTPSPTGSPSAARCANGRDDDRDGRRDFPADRGCTSRSDNTESPDPAPPAPPPPPAPAPAPAPPPPAPAPAPQPPAPAPPLPTTPPACNDGQDNDGDGWKDNRDGGCSNPFDNDESGGTPSPAPPPPPPPPTPPAPPPAPPSPTPSPASAPRLVLDDLAGDLLAPQLGSALPDEALDPLV